MSIMEMAYGEERTTRLLLWDTGKLNFPTAKRVIAELLIF